MNQNEIKTQIPTKEYNWHPRNYIIKMTEINLFDNKNKLNNCYMIFIYDVTIFVDFVWLMLMMLPVSVWTISVPPSPALAMKSDNFITLWLICWIKKTEITVYKHMKWY